MTAILSCRFSQPRRARLSGAAWPVHPSETSPMSKFISTTEHLSRLREMRDRVPASLDAASADDPNASSDPSLDAAALNVAIRELSQPVSVRLYATAGHVRREIGRLREVRSPLLPKLAALQRQVKSMGHGIGPKDLAARCALTAFSDAASAIDELIWDLEAMYGTVLTLSGEIHSADKLVEAAVNLLPDVR